MSKKQHSNNFKRSSPPREKCTSKLAECTDVKGETIKVTVAESETPGKFQASSDFSSEDKATESYALDALNFEVDTNIIYLLGRRSGNIQTSQSRIGESFRSRSNTNHLSRKRIC